MEDLNQQTPPNDQAPAPESEAPAWNGELTALEKEQWYSALDEPVRKSLRSGVETRLKNYERGVSQKMQTWASEKKDLESRLARAERSYKLYEQLAQGEEDPRVAEHAGRVAELEKQLAELTGDRDSWKSKLEAREQAEAEAEARKIIEAHQDIMTNEDAYRKFHRLISAGMEADEAAGMVRAVMPGLGSTKPPKDVELMSRGDGAGASAAAARPPEGMSLRERMLYVAEQALRANGGTP